MLVEIHIIQSFAPSNLNRDDTGAPKDCFFGGVRRARISSQCIKRAIREYFKSRLLISQENLATRTKHIVDEITKRLKEKGKDEQKAREVVKKMLAKGYNIAVQEDKDDTQYLLFIGEKEICRLVELCLEHWDALLSIQESEKEEKKKGKKKGNLPDEVEKALKDILDGGKACDLALFGRMLADKPENNIVAACQVAHAISTHRVSMEFDFYTAVDDLNPKEETGAGMMGTVEFNSACYYRYANIDLCQLKKNLDGDEELAKKTVEAFIKASAFAVPTGKQNSFAANNPPDFILATIRKNALPLNLANAFEKPVTPDKDGGLVTKSVNSLLDYWTRLKNAYNIQDDGNIFSCSTLETMREQPKCPNPSTIEDMVKSVVGKLAFDDCKS